MPSITEKFSLARKAKRTFTVLRRTNSDLTNEATTANTTSDRTSRLISLIPRVSHVLLPRPNLTLIQQPPTVETLAPLLFSSSSAASSTESLPTIHMATTAVSATPIVVRNTSTAAAPATTAPATPANAVPWPPQCCAAPLSTHHRLQCGHVVRTPFLTPCGANCGHVVSQPPPPPPPPPSAADAGAEQKQQLVLARARSRFVLEDEPFACPACMRELLSAAFAGLLARSAGGDGGDLVATHQRVVRTEMEGEGGRALMRGLGGRACEDAEERDGHGWFCP